MKYFSLTTLSDGSQGFEQSSIEVLFENTSESQCSRKCGGGVKVVHKGILSFDESCEVTSCDLCVETDINGSKCATWSALGLCVDDFIANECPITCCSWLLIISPHMSSMTCWRGQSIFHDWIAQITCISSEVHNYFHSLIKYCRVWNSHNKSLKPFKKKLQINLQFQSCSY